jgi:hypothetical protein
LQDDEGLTPLSAAAKYNITTTTKETWGQLKLEG